MIVKHYLWLISVGFFAVWSANQISLWSESIQVLVQLLPYITILFGVFIGLWLNRIQPVLILASLGCLNGILFYFSPSLGVDLAVSVMLPVLTFLLPLNILLWILLPEKGVHNKVFDSFILLLFLLQAIMLYWLVTELPLKWIEPFNIPIVKASEVIFLPFAGGLMFLMAGFILSIKIRSQSFKVLYHAVIVVLLLMAYGLNQVYEPGVLAWISTISAIVIILSMVFDAHHIAYTDELTGMYGRRALMESFLGLGRKYVVAMVDIDHFKKFNDSYGHDVGDDVLRTVANVLDSVKEGKAYRYGGEEFTLVFAGKTVEQVMPELERLRKRVESEIIEFECKEKPVTTKVTISIGVAQSAKEFKTAQDVLKFADEGLYQAKKAGRNKVIESKKKPAVKAKEPRSKSSQKTASKKGSK